MRFYTNKEAYARIFCKVCDLYLCLDCYFPARISLQKASSFSLWVE
jgi:hypothetical protein